MSNNYNREEAARRYQEEYIDGKNRCDRCNRPLSDPMAQYGWRCVQILGVEQNNPLQEHFFNQGTYADNNTSYALDNLAQVAYNDFVRTQSLKNINVNHVASYTNAGMSLMKTSDINACMNQGYDESGIWRDWDWEEFGGNSDTYNIINAAAVTFNEAPNGVEGDYKREAAYGLAEEARRLAREGTPMKYGQFIIEDTLHKNAERALRYQNELFPRIVLSNPYAPSPYTWFVDRTCGEWDYKFNDEWRVPYRTFNGSNMNENNAKNWTPWIYFDGMIVSADKFGNINLGYVGTKMGFSGFLLKNPTTMDKDDGPYVEYGIRMAEQGR